jgi:hypothetical protein
MSGRPQGNIRLGCHFNSNVSRHGFRYNARLKREPGIGVAATCRGQNRFKKIRFTTRATKMNPPDFSGTGASFPMPLCLRGSTKHQNDHRQSCQCPPHRRQRSQDHQIKKPPRQWPKLLALAVWQAPDPEFPNGLWLASYAPPALGTINLSQEQATAGNARFWRPIPDHPSYRNVGIWLAGQIPIREFMRT